jgi:hypothetical protein
LASELGAKTANLTKAEQFSFPWLTSLSRGGLFQPSQEFFSQIQALEKLFKEIHGNGISTNPDVIKSFLNYVLSQNLNIHPKICHCFAKTRTFIRLKYLNHQLLEGKEKKRNLRKVSHFIT